LHNVSGQGYSISSGGPEKSKSKFHKVISREIQSAKRQNTAEVNMERLQDNLGSAFKGRWGAARTTSGLSSVIKMAAGNYNAQKTKKVVSNGQTLQVNYLLSDHVKDGLPAALQDKFEAAVLGDEIVSEKLADFIKACDSYLDKAGIGTSSRNVAMVALAKTIAQDNLEMLQQVGESDQAIRQLAQEQGAASGDVITVDSDKVLDKPIVRSQVDLDSSILADILVEPLDFAVIEATDGNLSLFVNVAGEGEPASVREFKLEVMADGIQTVDAQGESVKFKSLSELQEELIVKVREEESFAVETVFDSGPYGGVGRAQEAEDDGSTDGSNEVVVVKERLVTDRSADVASFKLLPLHYFDGMQSTDLNGPPDSWETRTFYIDMLDGDIQSTQL